MPGTTSNKRKASNFKGPGRSLSGKVTQGTKLKKKVSPPYSMDFDAIDIDALG